MPPPPCPNLPPPVPTFPFWPDPLPCSSRCVPEPETPGHCTAVSLPVVKSSMSLGEVPGAWGGERRQGQAGEEEVSWVLGRTGLHSWVGTDGHCELSGQTETDRMDFLRLHLPGLHQALRGALVRGAERYRRLPATPCSLTFPLP